MTNPTKALDFYNEYKTARQKGHGGGPHSGDHRHGHHPAGVEGVRQQGRQIGSHAVGEDLQGPLNHGDPVAKVDLLHEGEQKGHKGQEGDQQEKGPVGRGGVQPVLIDAASHMITD